VLAGYRHEPGPPLPVPISVCFGEQDVETARGALLGWRRQSTFPVRLHGIDADHWLLDNACDELAEVVANVMSEAPAAR
jgi:medium-chain acyl-[acyl-carrier-protein] hydrolase